ncbi:MATE family efflux transporter [Endozoicomonas acroporae]|uniref:MATE family efflux transporter n=1 Tax=Endozoicomonas acroporae TaxID=1701104 RepID=UPI000C77665F|nr:MATE family efflux transporter [Endozoicomonas acroporae]
MSNNLSAFARYRGKLGELMYLAGPIMGAQLATTGMTFVDTSMAGQYSALDLASIAIGSSTWVPVYLLIRGILMAITPTVAHLYGARQTGEIAGQVRQGLWIALLMSLLALGFIYQSDVVLQWLQVGPAMAGKTLEYLKALAWGIPAICLFQALNCYCEGMGKTKPGMVFSFIALNFTSLTFMVPLSLSMGLTIRVGQALGAGKTAQAAYSSYAGIVTTLVSATLSAAVMLFLPGVVTSIYTQNTEVAILAAQLLVYAALFQYADGIQIAAIGALRGYKDTRVPMAMILFACWGVALPLGYILGLTDWIVAPMGPHGLWIGLVSALTMSAILLTLRLRAIIRHRVSAADNMAIS